MLQAIPATILLYFLGVFGHPCTNRLPSVVLPGGTYLILVIFCVDSSVSNAACEHKASYHGSNLLKFAYYVRAPAHLPWKQLRFHHGFVQNLQKSFKKYKIIISASARYPPPLYAGSQIHLLRD